MNPAAATFKPAQMSTSSNAAAFQEVQAKLLALETRVSSLQTNFSALRTTFLSLPLASIHIPFDNTKVTMAMYDDCIGAFAPAGKDFNRRARRVAGRLKGMFQTLRWAEINAGDALREGDAEVVESCVRVGEETAGRLERMMKGLEGYVEVYEKVAGGKEVDAGVVEGTEDENGEEEDDCIIIVERPGNEMDRGRRFSPVL